MTQMTDSFITQAEEAIKRHEHAPWNVDTHERVASALRSLLEEYKRLTTEQEWQYGWRFTNPLTQAEWATTYPTQIHRAMVHVRRSVIPAGPWVPVEGEDQ